ncbi:MAG TPA: hypothetical protein VFB38_26200 [Chthonomonadaceae bacterium]|nr:hypothetical protein [Chthonomonadaceae bacterium]
MQAPDTLDLRDYARLAIRHMAGNHDHKTGYPYFYINVHADVPSASHNGWDLIDVLSRYIDSLILAREMTGDTHGTDIEERYRRLLVENLNPTDGLAYRPETPWSQHEAEMFDQSRALNGLVTWYMQERSPELKGHIERMVNGLWQSAIHIVKRRAGYSFCFFPYASRFEEGWNPATPGEPCCYNGGALILPLTKYAEVSGDERALELARRFLHYIVDETRIFRRDGSFWPDEMHLAAGHFHTRSLSMAGILRYALLVHDPELIAWVKRAFDWAMTVSGSFGWFPEGVGTEDYYTTKHSETCNITDMVHLAIKLAEAGHPEYWGHVERFVRNHLLESQWTREDWLKPPAANVPEDDAVTTRRCMEERILGGYAGRTLPNEFVADGVMMGCCCGAGPRALFLAWDHILTRKPDGLYVNLHLNRYSREADVLSWQPHQGRLEVGMHSHGPLAIRVPEAAQESALSVERNGSPAPYTRRDGYVRIAEVGPGDSVTLRFSLQTEERHERLYNWPLQIKWRGDTVVAMRPEGHRLPLYRREPLDTDACPQREVSENERRDPAVRW